MAVGPGTTVGRQPELARLEGALDALDSGGLTCLAVEGEPGIGKTRLLGELRTRAEARGHLVLGGVAAEFERDLPFGVWIDALDAYVASQQPEGEWDPSLLGELAGVLPSLRAGRPPEAALADERFRVHRAVQRLLEHLAAERPLVLLLDDLHWSDDASIELIGALLRRSPDAPVLLALACRQGQAPPRLTAALAVRHVESVRLDPLSQAEAGELLGALDQAALAELYAQGGGNPFYLQQLARAGEPGGPAAARSARVGGGGVPAAVAASLAEELASLSLPARALLDGAAVAGEPFEPDLAAAIAELDEAAGLDALDALLARDLVRPTRVPRRFAFRHPLVRQAVYESSPGGWRLAAHARAAATLAQRGAGPAERAHHVEHSARPGDEAAIALLLAAGEEVLARAPSTATHWFETALGLLPGADRERQSAVRASLASALRSLGELERCRTTLLEAIELLPTDAVARRVELTTRCAAVEHWQGRHEDAHRRLMRAWEELADRDTPEGVALAIELAVDGLYELDLAQTLSIGRDALATAERLGDPALTAAAAAALALGEAAAGEIPAAREHRAQALAVDRLTDEELAPQLEALYYLGWAESYLEHYDEAVAHADRGISIARATGEGRLLLPLMLVKGYPFEMQGRMAEARELCETAVEAARLSANPHYLFWALFELAWARYYSGDLDGTIAACEESAHVGRRMVGGTMPSAGGGPGWALAVARFEAGEHERGHELMHAVCGDELEQKIPVERGFDWEMFTLAELAFGRIEGAAAYAERSERNAAALGLQLPAALAGRTRAAVLLAAGEPSEAARVAEQSAIAADGIGAHLQAAFSRHLMAARSLPRTTAPAPSRRCARPSRRSTRAAACACATRCVASCADSAHVPSRAGPRRRRSPGSAR